MPQDAIPEDVQRFILTCIPSIPHLEALLLLRANPPRGWEAREVAARLYVPEAEAAAVLADLDAAGLLLSEQAPQRYRYEPASDELRQLLDRVAHAYAAHLVEMTHLVHAKSDDRKARQFADAFKFRKDG